MSTVACASSSSEMRSRLPPRAAWCSAENLWHKAGLSPAPRPTVLSPQPPPAWGHGLRAGIVTGCSWLCPPRFPTPSASDSPQQYTDKSLQAVRAPGPSEGCRHTVYLGKPQGEESLTPCPLLGETSRMEGDASPLSMEQPGSPSTAHSIQQTHQPRGHSCPLCQLPPPHASGAARSPRQSVGGPW